MLDPSKLQTEQEKFWAGDFGDQYIDRNQGERVLAGNMNLFCRVFSRTANVQSVIELGANIGMNLVAIHTALPQVELSAVEINKKAIEELKKIQYLKEIHQASILNFRPEQKYDFVFTKGVLIYLDPEKIKEVYKLFYDLSSKYIMVAEYYNPSPVEVTYRGHEGKLFKRDFAGEIMDMFPDVRLVDYGFCYHLDPVFPLDDITWFLLCKE